MSGVQPTPPTSVTAPTSTIDTVAYNLKLKELANGDTTGLWPQKFAYPLPGAILPFNRIVAFYGNLYSTRMGILGEIPKDSMFKFAACTLGLLAQALKLIQKIMTNCFNIPGSI